MRVRFTAQWYSPQRNAWVPVEGVASSPWLDAGSAQYLYRQEGWTFTFDKPVGGSRFLIRGLAEMQWLDGGRVVRSATRVTRAGAVGVDEGDGGSRATCTIG
jgi:hypothetical protein